MIEPDVKRELKKWFDKFPSAKIEYFRNVTKYQLIKNESGQLVWRKRRG